MNIKKIAVSILIVGCSCTIPAAIPQQYTISGQGRRIQLDGFLLEWSPNNARPINGCASCSWDMTNTTDGLSGYFKLSGSSSCRPWLVSLYPQILALHRHIDFIVDTVNHDSNLYKVFIPTSSVVADSASTLLVEWVVPWDSIALDSLGRYNIGVTMVNRCGDTLAPLILSGTRQIKTGSLLKTVMTPRIIIQVVIIGVLLILYIVFVLRLKKKRGPSRKKRLS